MRIPGVTATGQGLTIQCSLASTHPHNRDLTISSRGTFRSFPAFSYTGLLLLKEQGPLATYHASSCHNLTDASYVDKKVNETNISE